MFRSTRALELSVVVLVLISSAGVAEIIPLPQGFADVVDVKGKAEIVSQLRFEMRQIGIYAADITCTRFLDYNPQIIGGRDTSWGALCSMKKGTEVMLCDDRLAGKFTLGGFGSLPEFIKENCPPGG